VPTIDRQDSVLNILQTLRDLDGLKRLFWEELNYERENRPLSPRQWPESARQPLAEDPILFATAGEDNAFHVVYCRLESDALLRGHERPIVNRLTREHPYALFVFSNKGRTDWHFLNVKYDEEADKRRLLRRITVRPGEGLRTAAERMQMLDLETIGPDLFALSPLTIQQRHDDAFDVEKVSKDFYREIANWYFWALKHVTFPKNAPKEQDGRDHISVIRLITRLIFCWFIREKGLIPDVLFDEPKLGEMLDGFAPGKKRNKDSVFYRAILQNLFFATLNTEMDQRGWRRADQNFMAHSLYRHKECFRDPKAGLEWFKDIPFLNGGLFECLDRDFGEGAKPRYLRVDGFSDRDDSRPTVPDFLFFGPEQDIDLSGDYGDKKFRSVCVRGLIDTLNRYKFTIEENTPFDQEVALDPELCGKVFENLLAAYNPETGTTARKATGSFYTPREIVDYMVDESLVAYLKGKLEGGTGIPACASPSSPQTGMSVSPSVTITRRNLPHWTKEGAIYWVTFRLADSLPQDKLRAWSEERDIWKKAHPEPWSDADWEEYDERFGKRLDEWLDAGYGSRALMRPDVRDAVRECLMKFDGQRVRVHAAVIMPTHVHVVLEPLGANVLPQLLKGIKGASARQANDLLGTGGTFWMDESYDHIVRSEKQYRHFLRYVAENPRKANLGDSEYWLLKGDTDIPVRDSAQAGMPVPPSSRESHIRALLAYDAEMPEFSEKETETLIDAIDGLKALDPAVGSGAFPMGILHKLVLVLGKLDPDNERWKAKQIAKLDDATMREDAERLFRENYDDYGRKLYLIENCIYGVDIQPIAVQIAKMRFFISLIVDQKVEGGTGIPACADESQTGMSVSPNRGVRALPNLETKFVAANTLIGIDRPAQMMLRNPEIDKKEAELRQVRQKHFTARTLKSKAKCRDDDKRLRSEIAELLKNDGWDNTTAKQLAAWDPYDQNAHADFFDPEWMFGVTVGFDMVIGNPPYGFRKIHSAEEKQYFKQYYRAAKGSYEHYFLFYERTLAFLRPDGTHGFIAPVTWLTIPSAQSLREVVLTGYALSEICWFADQVFLSASVNNLITLIRQIRPAETSIKFFASLDSLPSTPTRVNRVKQERFVDDGCYVGIFEDLDDRRIVDRMSRCTVPLKQYARPCSGYNPYEVGKGIAPDGKPHTKQTVSEKPYHSERKCGKDWKPEIIGRDLSRYAVSLTGHRWIKYGPWLAAPRNPANYTGRRILVQEITGGPEKRIVAAYHDKPLYHSRDVIPIKVEDPFPHAYYLLAILNSRLMSWYHHKRNPKAQKGLFPKVLVGDLSKMPIRALDPSVQQDRSAHDGIVKIVERILVAKAADPAADTSAWEREINERVYKLYGLTAEEIKIVEGEGTRR
jgi:REP element-mobilizing transposase RayT